jgi:large subunit ribosomal protein L13
LVIDASVAFPNALPDCRNTLRGGTSFRSRLNADCGDNVIVLNADNPRNGKTTTEKITHSSRPLY